MNSLAVYDRDLAIERAGGSAELATDLFGMLLRELPHTRSGIIEARAGGDLASLQRQAHKLNGSATYTGVSALREAVAALESSLKHDQTGQLDRQVEAVLVEIDRVLQFAKAS